MTFIDWFAGIGGFRRGMELQGHKCVGFCEFDKDCIWYRPEARNRCPVTCAQYRDGWNDAMNYVFRDGEGYRPYRRDKKYEEGREE